MTKIVSGFLRRVTRAFDATFKTPTAFELGQKAARAGQGAGDNPYRAIFDPAHYRDWRDGFHAVKNIGRE
jgi:hypothetical protein